MITINDGSIDPITIEGIIASWRSKTLGGILDVLTRPPARTLSTTSTPRSEGLAVSTSATLRVRAELEVEREEEAEVEVDVGVEVEIEVEIRVDDMPKSTEAAGITDGITGCGTTLFVRVLLRISESVAVK